MKVTRILLISSLGLCLACSTSACGDYAESWWNGSIDIPHGGRTCLDLTISGAPAEADVTAVLYKVNVEPRGDPDDFWCSDYEIYLSNDTHGGPVDYLCVWDNDGGKTDEGQDDDPEDDSSIFLQRLLPAAFDGEPVNQKWYICVRQTAIHPLPLTGLGRLTRAGWKIMYDAPKPDLYDAGESYRSFSPTTVHAGKPGQAFEVQCRIENGGDGVAGPYKVFFVASADPIIRLTDRYLGDVIMPELPPGSYAECTLSGMFPTDIPANMYYVGWIIDVLNSVAERDETNNVAFKERYMLTVLHKVSVPDVVGMSLSQAQGALASVGLTVGATSGQYSDTVPEGHVIAQDPAAWTSVPHGSAVDLVISLGPQDGPAEPEACCFGGGTCQDLTAIDCLAQGGTPQGAGTNCASTTCPTGPFVPGLMAHWKLDETSGLTAHDSSGNGSHGSIYGDPVWQPSGGMIDGALQFDGIDDYADCGSDASLDISEEITVAAWVRTYDAGNGEHNPFVTKGDHSYAIKHFGLNSIEFVIYDGDWRAVHFPVDSSFNGVWHHLAGTYNGSHLDLYIDGKLKASTPHQGSIASSSFNVNMARNSESSHRFYDGLLDDVRIYNYALGADEIIQLLCAEAPKGDLNGDCRVGFEDLAILVSQWLECTLLVEELCWEQPGL